MEISEIYFIKCSGDEDEFVILVAGEDDVNAWRRPNTEVDVPVGGVRTFPMGVFTVASPIIVVREDDPLPTFLRDGALSGNMWSFECLIDGVVYRYANDQVIYAYYEGVVAGKATKVQEFTKEFHGAVKAGYRPGLED